MPDGLLRSRSVQKMSAEGKADDELREHHAVAPMGPRAT